jgi:hypothetical protein
MMHDFVEKLWNFTTAAHDDISNRKLEITLMQICHRTGLDAQQATWHSHVGHHKVPV